MQHWTLAIEMTERRKQEIVDAQSLDELITIAATIAAEGEGAFSLWPFGISHDTESLLCCVESPYAFCQFTPRSPHDPRPVLWTVGTADQPDTYIELNLGGTATAVRMANCIKIAELHDIVRHYYLTTSLWPGVVWSPAELT